MPLAKALKKSKRGILEPLETATSLHKTSTSSFTIFIVFQCSRLRHVELGGDYRSVAQVNWLFSTLLMGKA